jgi:hypothetical protein
MEEKITKWLKESFTKEKIKEGYKLLILFFLVWVYLYYQTGITICSDWGGAVVSDGSFYAYKCINLDTTPSAYTEFYIPNNTISSVNPKSLNTS